MEVLNLMPKKKKSRPTTKGKHKPKPVRAGKKKKSPPPSGLPTRAHVTYSNIPSGMTLSELQAVINDKLQSVATDVFSGEDTLTLNFNKVGGP
jgi:hypothetical protein